MVLTSSPETRTLRSYRVDEPEPSGVAKAGGDAWARVKEILILANDRPDLSSVDTYLVE